LPPRDGVASRIFGARSGSCVRARGEGVRVIEERDIDVRLDGSRRVCQGPLCVAWQVSRQVSRQVAQRRAGSRDVCGTVFAFSWRRVFFTAWLSGVIGWLDSMAWNRQRSRCSQRYHRLAAGALRCGLRQSVPA